MEKIRFDNLNFTYPLSEKPALENINLTINQSEFIVLCGKSGCGKSTLLRHLKKNMMPYGDREGAVLYCGENIEFLDDRRSASEIGFVQQNPDNQLVTDKVWHELAFGLESLGMSAKTIKKRVAEMTSYFGIQSWFRRDVSTLSGGQKQLLNLASVMAMQPDILVLDEPASQLDPIAASDFLKTVQDINRDLGTTVIISEHRLEEVFPMADRVIVMDKGKIISDATPGQTGNVLAGDDGNDPHPMFFGLPSVTRIFQPFGREENPLTIREGRLEMEELVCENSYDASEDDSIKNLESDTALEKKSLFSRESKDDIAIQMKYIWFKYDKKSNDVLRGMSLSVKKGQWHCLLGGNGTGKSTTLKAICGIIKPQRGSVTVENINVGKDQSGRLFDKCLAMVPQNPQSVFTEITVEEELFEGMEFMDLSDETKVENVENMLKLMEIEHLRKANPYDLSGGEQQRLAIGKILLLEPTVLLMDEPTKGLDPFFKMTLAGILRKLVNRGVTIFMVSHDIEFCASYADRCSMFFDGEIVSEDESKAFFAGNNFYTTAANKIVRKYRKDLVTCEEVQDWIRRSVIQE